MSKLDDILHPIVVDATDYTVADKEQIKALILELVREEQKNWDDKDGQTMWGNQALELLAKKVEEL